MGFLKAWKTLDDKFAWSFTSLVLSILFFLFGLYTTFLYEKKPRLRYEIASQSPVYNIREQIPKLVVLFDGENIHEKHQMLTLITRKIAVSVQRTASGGLHRPPFDSTLRPS